MDKKKMVKAQFAIILFAMVLLIGCGGGGGDKSPPSDPGVSITPSTFDFGTVTIGNTPAALQVKINSSGTTNLIVSSIAISGDQAFSLNRNPASNACGNSATITPDDFCAFEVGFDPAEVNNFSASVLVSTNAGMATLNIAGASEAVNAFNVSISQVTRDCTPTLGPWMAYVSVTDQSGYPYLGLEQSNFELAIGGVAVPITNFTAPPDQSLSPISIVAAMDYSSSITDIPEITIDMEEGLVDFINQMTGDDQAEIIKFDNIWEVVHNFSPDKTSLAVAIRAPFDHGADTLLWDTLFKAVTDAGGQVGRRRAVIVLTDGFEIMAPGGESINNLDSVITQAQALDVPIFPVALGTELNEPALQRISEETGGQLYRAPTSDSLRIAFLQVASVLFQNQYILEFGGPPPAVGTDTLTVTVTKAPLLPANSPPKIIELCAP